MSLLKSEPVATGVVSLVTAAIAVLVAFGVHLTSAQQGAVVALVVAALGVAALVRSRVTPVAK